MDECGEVEGGPQTKPPSTAPPESNVSSMAEARRVKDSVLQLRDEAGVIACVRECCAQCVDVCAGVASVLDPLRFNVRSLRLSLLA